LTLVFAASALARKGAGAVRHAARELNARVLILGTPPADLKAWEGIEWSPAGYASDWIARADAVVLPAHIEHQPRALLQAMAAGVPVFASAACGLGGLQGWVEVEAGSGADLVAALRAKLSPTIQDVREPASSRIPAETQTSAVV
jgi:glycosyltransferase involved in cell wall biosynthesis